MEPAAGTHDVTEEHDVTEARKEAAGEAEAMGAAAVSPGRVRGGIGSQLLKVSCCLILCHVIYRTLWAGEANCKAS